MAECPYCGCYADAEFVDIGVGYQQVTPYSCGNCDALQMNPYNDNSRATEEEKKFGWWKGRDE